MDSTATFMFNNQEFTNDHHDSFCSEEEEDSNAEDREQQLDEALNNTFAELADIDDDGDPEISETESVSNAVPSRYALPKGQGSSSGSQSTGGQSSDQKIHSSFSEKYHSSSSKDNSSNNGIKNRKDDFSHVKSSFYKKDRQFSQNFLGNEDSSEITTEMVLGFIPRTLSTNSRHLSKHSNSSELSELQSNNALVNASQVQEVDETNLENEYQHVIEKETFSTNSVFQNIQKKLDSLDNGTAEDIEHQQLHVSDLNHGNQILKLKQEMLEIKEYADKTVEHLSRQVTLLNEKNQHYETMLENKDLEMLKLSSQYNEIKGKFDAMAVELVAEKNAKIKLQQKVESASLTIRALGSNQVALARSETIANYKDQHEEIVRVLKQRHKEEILELKKDNENLKGFLEKKTLELQHITETLNAKTQECDQLCIEKSKLVNQFRSTLQESQQQCEQLLASGKMTEITQLHIQIKQLEAEKLSLESNNSFLKEQITDYKTELQSLYYSRDIQNKMISEKELLNEDLPENIHPAYKMLVNTQATLDETLNLLQKQKAITESLETKLRDTEREFFICKKRAEEFQQKFEEVNVIKSKLESEINSVGPEGSIPMVLHKKKLSDLESYKVEIENQLKETQIKLDEVTRSERKLNDLNRQLRAELSTIVKQHDVDKQQSRDECMKIQTEEVIQLRKAHQMEVSSLKKEINQLNKELDLLRQDENIENKEQLEEELKHRLIEEIRNKVEKDAKSNLEKAKLEMENSLKSQWEKINKPELEKNLKEQLEKNMKEEIEKDMKLQLENKIREELQKNLKHELEKEIKLKLKKSMKPKLTKEIKEEYEKKMEELALKYEQDSEKWLQERAAEIQTYEERTKIQLIKEYDIIVEQMKKEIEDKAKIEKEQIIESYEKKMKENVVYSQTEDKSLPIDSEELFSIYKKLILHFQEFGKAFEAACLSFLNQENTDIVKLKNDFTELTDTFSIFKNCISKLEDENAEKINRVKNELESHYQDLLQKEKMKFEKEIKQQSEEHQTFFENLKGILQEKWSEEKDNLASDFKIKIDQIRQMYLQMAEDKVKAYENNISELQEEIEKFQSNILDLQNEKDKLSDQILKLENEKSEFQHQLHQKIKSENHLNLKLKASLEKEKDLQSALVNANDKNTHLNEKLKKSTKESAKLKSQLASVEKKMENLKVSHKDLFSKVETCYKLSKKEKSSLNLVSTTCQTEGKVVYERDVIKVKENCCKAIKSAMRKVENQKQRSENKIIESFTHCMNVLINSSNSSQPIDKMRELCEEMKNVLSNIETILTKDYGHNNPLNVSKHVKWASVLAKSFSTSNIETIESDNLMWDNQKLESEKLSRKKTTHNEDKTKRFIKATNFITPDFFQDASNDIEDDSKQKLSSKTRKRFHNIMKNQQRRLHSKEAPTSIKGPRSHSTGDKLPNLHNYPSPIIYTPESLNNAFRHDDERLDSLALSSDYGSVDHPTAQWMGNMYNMAVNVIKNDVTK